jgi:hypothetical protein
MSRENKQVLINFIDVDEELLFLMYHFISKDIRAAEEAIIMGSLALCQLPIILS